MTERRMTKSDSENNRSAFCTRKECEERVNDYFTKHLAESGEVADIESLADYLGTTRDEIMAMLEKKLAAEREQQKAELATKYFAKVYGYGNSNENDASGYVPDISEKELAKQLISSATGGEQYINSEYQAYIVNRYLLDLKDNYNLNSEYFKNLVLILKSHGYTQVSESEMRTQVIAYDAETKYDDKYDEIYDQSIMADKTEEEARAAARKAAKKVKMDYIFKNSKSKDEFKRYCIAADIAEKDINDYLNSGVTFPSQNINSGGLLGSGLLG